MVFYWFEPSLCGPQRHLGSACRRRVTDLALIKGFAQRAIAMGLLISNIVNLAEDDNSELTYPKQFGLEHGKSAVGALCWDLTIYVHLSLREGLVYQLGRCRVARLADFHRCHRATDGACASCRRRHRAGRHGRLADTVHQ